MERRKTLGRLKVACGVTAVLGAALFFGAAPATLRALDRINPTMFWIDLVYIWIIGGLSFAALGEAWKICVEIGRDNSFSMENVRSLKRISRLMNGALGMMAAGLAFVLMAKTYSAVLLGLIGLGICIALIFSLFAKALAELMLIGAELKQENDLTI